MNRCSHGRRAARHDAGWAPTWRKPSAWAAAAASAPSARRRPRRRRTPRAPRPAAPAARGRRPRRRAPRPRRRRGGFRRLALAAARSPASPPGWASPRCCRTSACRKALASFLLIALLIGGGVLPRALADGRAAPTRAPAAVRRARRPDASSRTSTRPRRRVRAGDGRRGLARSPARRAASRRASTPPRSSSRPSCSSASCRPRTTRADRKALVGRDDARDVRRDREATSRNASAHAPTEVVQPRRRRARRRDRRRAALDERALHRARCARTAPCCRRTFDEIWNLVKPVDGSSGWLLAGIQQAQ